MHKLVLLRHGESTWNRENRFTGWTDVDLSERGVAEATEAGRLLRDGGYVFDLEEPVHVRVLEGAGLVATEKVGRVRTCRVGPRRLTDEAGWIGEYQALLDARLDRLAAFLERMKAKPS